MTTFAAISAVLICGAFFYWRYVWFFRNPRRVPPSQPAILSPTDGTVVYVKQIDPQHNVLVIKKGVQTTVNDIVREDMAASKILIGVFMSPFNVHYNRTPITGVVEFVRHHPAQGKNLSMWCMHLRTVLKLAPYYRSSRHVFQNERTVTKINGPFKGREVACYGELSASLHESAHGGCYDRLNPYHERRTADEAKRSSCRACPTGRAETSLRSMAEHSPRAGAYPRGIVAGGGGPVGIVHPEQNRHRAQA